MGAELTHSQAVNRLKDIYDEVERFNQKEALSDEDAVVFADLTREFEEVDDHRKNLERKATTAKLRNVREGLTRELIENRGVKVDGGDTYDLDPILEPDSVTMGRFRNPWDLSEVRTFNRDRGEVTHEMRARALSAVEKMPGANDQIRQAATKILEQFDDGDGKLARMCLATSSPAYMRAWVKQMSGRASSLSQDESQALERAMSLTDSAGGYLVPFQLDPTVIITSNGSRNQIRQVARQVIATGDVWNGVSSGAVSWSWDTEGSQVSDDTTTFAQPAIPIYTARGFVPISFEALDDAANVTAEVGRLLAFGKDTLEATSFATGAGGTEPTGIITALVASSGGSSLSASATADTFAIGDVYGLDTALPARYRANATWLANRGLYNLIRRFDTAGGAGMWERIGNGLPPELLGRPAYEAEAMDGTVTAAAENYVLVFGDFENYVIADRIGMSVEFIPNLFGANGRPTGQRGWFAYYRAGADSVNDSAFKLLNVT